MNQSEIEAHASNEHQVWKNAHEPVTSGFGFTSDWLSKWRAIF